MSFLNELKRRNVLRVGTAYIVSSWLLIQVVETIFPAFGFGDAAVRIATIVLGIGLVPTLILAWAFELTPEGLKRDSDVDREQSITHVTGKKLDRIILVVLALALAYFAFDKFVMVPARVAEIVEETTQKVRSDVLVESYGDKSIAVLPFVNMSSDKEQEFFSDGISEELLNLLAKIKELRVISRSSSFSFKGQDVAIPEVARRLNVAHVLEGSVRKSGDRVRITAQLIEARTDTHLWSNTYDRELDDIFAIQDEIAAQVVGQLKISLLGESPKVRKTDPEAYTAYLQAGHFADQFTDESINRALELYQHALDVDPSYLDAWIGLAITYLDQEGFGLRARDDAVRLAREAAYRPLAIQPNYARAHQLIGWIATIYDNDLVIAARHYQQALDFTSNASNNKSLLNSVGAFCLILGRLDDAIVMFEKASLLDPVDVAVQQNLGQAYLWAWQLDKAINSFRATLALSPNYLGAQSSLGQALLLSGQPKAAMRAMQAEQNEPYRLIGLTLVHHDLNMSSESNANLEELINKYEKEWAFNIAYVFAYRGEHDHAFEWLDKAIAYDDPGLSAVDLENLFEKIHDDPRWLPLLEKVGRSSAQLNEIEFSIALPK